MQIWNVDEDGCVYHWVIAEDAAAAIEFVKAMNRDAGAEHDEPPPYEATLVPRDKELRIDLGSCKVAHTAEEWLAIYDHKARYLACSEY